jgi:hypothetical protein
MVPKFKLVALALLLVWSTTQCALACALEPCAETQGTAPSEPSCHHHHESPGNPGLPSRCPHQTVQADIPKTFTTLTFTASPVIAFAVASLLPSFLVSVEARPYNIPSPPGFSVLSSVILRI